MKRAIVLAILAVQVAGLLLLGFTALEALAWRGAENYGALAVVVFGPAAILAQALLTALLALFSRDFSRDAKRTALATSIAALLLSIFAVAAVWFD